MAIWSLTKERVEKLLKQIGDKELEIDTLIKLSKEDLWTKDLDEFITEWRFQLEDEAKRQKKAASQGRRVSSKLKTQIKPMGRKRKNDDSFSDSDFSSKKSKKPAVVKNVQPKAAPSAVSKQPILSTLSNGSKTSKLAPVAKLADDGDKELWTTLDGADGPNSDHPVAPIFVKTKAASRIKKSALPKSAPSKPTEMEPGGEDEDEPLVRPSAPTAGARAPRAAARKPIKYTNLSDSDSDNGDDMLFDVGKMVKGIGSSTTDTSTTTRPLFSTTASLSRPGSSAGFVARKSMGKAPVDLDNTDDETDYTRLAPVSNGGKKIIARSTVLSDDDNGDEGSDIMVGTVRSATMPKTKSSDRSAAKASTVKNVPAQSGKEKKPNPLSPAAKAYAAKQKARSTSVPAATANAASKKKEGVDTDSRDELEKVADEMLSDDDDEVVAAPRWVRATRAAATKPKKWIIEDEDDEDAEEEEDDDVSGFVDDESD